ncbi:MAG: hypothetical protein QXW35_05130 [Candidatus Aenigmatarchaeota archaeon]
MEIVKFKVINNSLFLDYDIDKLLLALSDESLLTIEYVPFYLTKELILKKNAKIDVNPNKKIKLKRVRSDYITLDILLNDLNYLNLIVNHCENLKTLSPNPSVLFDPDLVNNISFNVFQHYVRQSNIVLSNFLVEKKPEFILDLDLTKVSEKKLEIALSATKIFSPEVYKRIKAELENKLIRGCLT